MDRKAITQGKLTKNIFLFSLPLMFTNVLQVLFNMADLAVAGRFAGSEYMGAIGCTASLVFLFTGFMIGLGGGVNVITARYIGAELTDQVEETVHTSLIICFLAGVVMLLIGIFGSPIFLRWLGTKPELMPLSVKYLQIYFWGMPALGVYNFGSAVLSAAGETRKPLIFLSIAGAVNVCLNLLLVIGRGMDVDGVAYATVTAQYLSASMVILCLLKRKDCIRLRFRSLRIHPRKAKTLLTLGLPAGLQNSIFAIANLFVQSGVNTFDPVVVEGVAAAANGDGLIFQMMYATYVGCATFVSQNYGAGNRDRIMKSYKVALFWGVAVSAAACALLLIFGEEFLSLFTKEPAVVKEGMVRLRVMAFSVPVSAFMDCTIAASRGLGRTAVPTVIVIIGSCLFRVVWVYTVFAWIGTVMSLYLLYIFSWAITAAAEIIYFHRIYRRLTLDK